MSERGSAGTSERDQAGGDHLYVLLFAIGAHSISKEVARFSPLWFPRGKSLVSIVSCD